MSKELQLLREVFDKINIAEHGSMELYKRVAKATECEHCDDNGYGYWHCCNGNYLGADIDIDICSRCGEHMGEENCQDCNG